MARSHCSDERGGGYISKPPAAGFLYPSPLLHTVFSGVRVGGVYKISRPTIDHRVLQGAVQRGGPVLLHVCGSPDPFFFWKMWSSNLFEGLIFLLACSVHFVHRRFWVISTESQRSHPNRPRTKWTEHASKKIRSSKSWNFTFSRFFYPTTGQGALLWLAGARATATSAGKDLRRGGGEGRGAKDTEVGPFLADTLEMPQRSKKKDLDRNFQSRSKFLISLESFDLDVSISPQKIGPRWVARSKISFSIEIFNLDRNLEFFWSLGPLGTLEMPQQQQWEMHAHIFPDFSCSEMNLFSLKDLHPREGNPLKHPWN